MLDTATIMGDPCAALDWVASTEDTVNLTFTTRDDARAFLRRLTSLRWRELNSLDTSARLSHPWNNVSVGLASDGSPILRIFHVGGPDNPLVGVEVTKEKPNG